MSVFKISFSLSELISNASFLRDFTNDQNLFAFSFFSRAAGIRTFRLKRDYVENMFQICISDDLLNMCSEPFVMVLRLCKNKSVSANMLESKRVGILRLFFYENL